MTWHTGRLCLLDFETTGVDPHRDRIVTAAVLEVGAGAKTLEQEWLADPGISIPDGAASIHGIPTAYAQANGRPAAAVVREVAERILSCTNGSGMAVVGHNVTYDLTTLWAECHRHGLTDFANMLGRIRPVIDTLVLDKWGDPWRPKAPTKRRPDPAKCGDRTLTTTAALYGVALTQEDAHGARADALAAGRLAFKLAVAYPGLQAYTAAELHDWLVTEKREQADSFGAYLVKQGKPDDIAREWPIQAPPPGWTPEQLPTIREEAAVA